VGARVDDNERFGTYTTVRLGAVYRLPGSARLRVSAGNGFREPSFFENYASGFAVGNPDLKPEHSRSGEIGIEQGFAAGRVAAAGTVFDQRFLEMLDYNSAGGAGTSDLPGSARLRVSAGNGFREPSFFENYASGFAVGNPDLKPEHSRSGEIGIEQGFAAGRVTAAVTVFDQRFLDMIDYNPAVAAGT